MKFDAEVSGWLTVPNVMSQACIANMTVPDHEPALRLQVNPGVLGCIYKSNGKSPTLPCFSFYKSSAVHYTPHRNLQPTLLNIHIDPKR